MRQDATRKPPQFPTDVTARPGQGEAAPEDGGRRIKPFLPMMKASRYAEYKSRPPVKAPSPFFGREAALRAALVAAPATLTVLADIDGASDVDGLIPPDTHGGVGTEEFVEITNSHIDIFERSDPTTRTSISQAAFFGYFTQTLFDARAVYDSTWNRWILATEAAPESPTVQLQFIAVSTTPRATGPFFIYNLNVAFFSGDFWDFPQLGIDQDSIIITANIFDASGNPKGADMFAVPKARLYNGLGFSVPVFTGLVGTLAPPIVVDNNSNTFLIAAQPSGSALQLYTLRDSSRAGITLTGPLDVPVDPYDMPLPATQPAPCTDPAHNLDTSDSRFVNASTQVGDALWQVHTIDLAGLPTPKYYQVNTVSNAIDQSGVFFATGTSSDFNASIAANSDNDVVVSWTSTDAAGGTNAQVRFAGCDHATGPCGFLGSGSALFTSPTCITGDFDPRFGLQRWGDYSAVTIDPTNPRQAWFVNEKVNDSDTWGSRIGEVSF
ncbi:MAG: hypothetical protein LC808_29265 [Actinobacteria bacterium]|nr:hypothetical protein [Actinomycetota bacterium]